MTMMDWCHGDCGRSRQDKLQGGRENATQDSPAVRVYIAACKHWDFGGFHRVGREACAGTCAVARERAHHHLAKRMPSRAAQACVLSCLWQRGDKTCERSTKGHVHIWLIKKCLRFIYLLPPSWFISRLCIFVPNFD